MRITEREGNVLNLLQLNGELGIDDIAQRLGYKPHSVRYLLERLKNHHGVFQTPFIDLSPLGFNEYLMYFTVSPDKYDVRERLIATLRKANLVKWIVELGGEFHYVMGIVARDAHQIAVLVDAITARFGEVFVQKQIAMTVSLRRYSRRYLVEKKFWGNPMSLSPQKRCDSFDELDHKILTEMTRGSFSGLGVVAKRVGAPLSTVRYREARLRENGIIRGYIYALSSVLAGTSAYRILLSAKGPTKEFDKSFWSFCDQHPHVVHGVRVLGAWDYEIDAEVTATKELSKILNDIQRQLGFGLNHCKCEPDMEFLLVSTYPLRDFRLISGSSSGGEFS